MIVLQNVGKTLQDGKRRTPVFKDLSCQFPSRRAVGILALPSSGKTTLMRMVAGLIRPEAGNISRSGRVSLLVGSSAYINRLLSPRENIVFLARLYGVADRGIIAFVRDFGELGAAIDRPIIELSKAQKSQYLLTVSWAFPADFYAADETIIGGVGPWRKRCGDLVLERRRSAGLVFTTGSPKLMELFADIGAVLHEGRLEFHPSVPAAIKRFRRLKIEDTRRAAKSAGGGGDDDSDIEDVEELDS